MGKYKYRVTGPRGGKYLTTTRKEAEKLTKHGGSFKALGQRKASKVKNPSTRMVPGAKFLAKKYGIPMTQAQKLALNPELEANIEEWRLQEGLPSPRSPLVRGMIRDLLKERRHNPNQPTRGAFSETGLAAGWMQSDAEAIDEAWGANDWQELHRMGVISNRDMATIKRMMAKEAAGQMMTEGEDEVMGMIGAKVRRAVDHYRAEARDFRRHSHRNPAKMGINWKVYAQSIYFSIGPRSTPYTLKKQFPELSTMEAQHLLDIRAESGGPGGKGLAWALKKMGAYLKANQRGGTTYRNPSHAGLTKSEARRYIRASHDSNATGLRLMESKIVEIIPGEDDGFYIVLARVLYETRTDRRAEAAGYYAEDYPGWFEEEYEVNEPAGTAEVLESDAVGWDGD